MMGEIQKFYKKKETQTFKQKFMMGYLLWAMIAKFGQMMNQLA